MSGISNIGRSPAGIKSVEAQSVQKKNDDRNGYHKDVPTGVRLVDEKEGYTVDISPGSQTLSRTDREPEIKNADDARELAGNLRNEIFQQSENAAMAQANIDAQSVLNFLK